MTSGDKNITTTLHVLRQVTLAALLAVGAAAQAAPTLYTSQDSFLAAVAAVATDTFNDLPQAQVAAPLVRIAGPYGYQASAVFNSGGTSGFYNVGTPGDTWLSTDSAADLITFSGFSSNVFGVGGFFFGTNMTGALQPAQWVVITATDASGTLTHTVTEADTSSFRGFVTTSGFTSLTVSTIGLFVWPTVNDLKLASAVPEPAGWALLAGGLIAVSLLRRQRR